MADRMEQFAQYIFDSLLDVYRIIEMICFNCKVDRGAVQGNGRNPDIVSSYSFSTGIALATEACQEKSSEIKAVPEHLDKIDIAGKIITADAMSMPKDIIETIRRKWGENMTIIECVISNQRINRDTHLIKTPVRKQPLSWRIKARHHRAQPLVDRKYALGT